MKFPTETVTEINRKKMPLDVDRQYHRTSSLECDARHSLRDIEVESLTSSIPVRAAETEIKASVTLMVDVEVRHRSLEQLEEGVAAIVAKDDGTSGKICVPLS